MIYITTKQWIPAKLGGFEQLASTNRSLGTTHGFDEQISWVWQVNCFFNMA
jgi:hypothetical protein